MWWMFDTDQCLPFGLPSWFDLYEKRKKAKKNEEVVFDKWKRLRSCKYTFSSEYFLYWEIRFDWIRWCSTNRSRKEIFTSKKLFCMIFFFFSFFFSYLCLCFILKASSSFIRVDHICPAAFVWPGHR